MYHTIFPAKSIFATAPRQPARGSVWQAVWMGWKIIILSKSFINNQEFNINKYNPYPGMDPASGLDSVSAGGDISVVSPRAIESFRQSPTLSINERFIRRCGRVSILTDSTWPFTGVQLSSPLSGSQRWKILFNTNLVGKPVYIISPVSYLVKVPTITLQPSSFVQATPLSFWIAVILRPVVTKPVTAPEPSKIT